MARPDDGPEFVLEDYELDEKTHVIAAAGPVDLFAAPEFKEVLTRIIESGKRWIVVDFTDASIVDSTLLGALLGARRRLQVRGGGLAIVCPKPGIRKVFEVTGFDRMFVLEAKIGGAQEALRAVGRR
jgi:anti-sigma B factor antagonist